MPKVLTVTSTAEARPQLPTTDAGDLDLTDWQNWPHVSLLIDAKFFDFLRQRYPDQYRQFADGKGFAHALFDEFVIEQARMIGVRVLFNPKVLITLYKWSLYPTNGRNLWKRLSKNIQAALDGRKTQHLGVDPRSPGFYRELCQDLKIFRKCLRGKASVSRWNFPTIVNILPDMLRTFKGERLSSNSTIFVDYVRAHEEIFRQWLNGGPNHTFALGLLGWKDGYKSGEMARQAIQRRKERDHEKSKQSSPA